LEDQAASVKMVDEESTRIASLRGGAVSRGGHAIRLAFAPQAVLINELLFNGGLFGGVQGLRRSVNAWAIAFATEAKRYEKAFSAPASLPPGKA